MIVLFPPVSEWLLIQTLTYEQALQHRAGSFLADKNADDSGPMYSGFEEK